jgi:hypothetical protein
VDKAAPIRTGFFNLVSWHPGNGTLQLRVKHRLRS